ncbi:hypothetical protein P43SY_008770 [Pythium insidiosum]|uniref:Ras-GAP domain-containing protein n=1 Tax=Pythium insidiosum TaxID=114742 RepID=A0AAD5Q6X9_PYTIN|nr:hypothetical protein P43SY_008770 [Pythium insidiosum]
MQVVAFQYANHRPPSSSSASARRRAASRPMLRRIDSLHDLPPLHLERQRSQSDMPRLHAFEDALRKEIAATEGREELFLRSTSELTTLLRELSHEHGRAYFRYVLRDVFGESSTLYDGACPTHDQALSLAEGILKRMVRAIHYAPLVLRACTQMMLRAFQDAFPTSSNAVKVVVGGVLFLRVICPALVKPESFGFRPHTSASLPIGVQLAKLLQCVLRGHSAQAQDADFVATFHPFLESFLTRFPQLSESTTSPLKEPSRRPAPFARGGSWDTPPITRGPLGSTGSWQTVEDTNRLRGVSMSTPEDMKQRKRKFSLKFW